MTSLTMPTVSSQEHWIDTSAGRLFARSWEPGTPENQNRASIVLFHDSLGCVSLWRDFPAQLAASTGRRVIAYDRFGFGLSAPHPGGWSARFIRDEAEQVFPLLCAALALERVIPFGYSVGGAMAASCAALYPDSCDALITLSAQAFVDAGVLDGIRQAQDAFGEPGQRDRLARHHGDKADWVLQAWIDTWLSEAFSPWRIEHAAPEIRCPLLVIHGDQDEYGSLAHPRHIAALGQAASELRILPNCRHVPHREYPALLLETVRRFLARRN